MSNMSVQMILSLLYNRAGAKDAIADLKAIEKEAATLGKGTKAAAPAWVEHGRAINRAREETQKLSTEARAFQSVSANVGATIGKSFREGTPALVAQGRAIKDAREEAQKFSTEIRALGSAGGLASATFGPSAWAQNATQNFAKVRSEAKQTTEDMLRQHAQMKAAAAPSSPWGYTPGDAVHRARVEKNRAWARGRSAEDKAMRDVLPPVPPVVPPKDGKGDKEGDGLVGGMLKTTAGYMTAEKAMAGVKRAREAARDATHSAISLETQGTDPHEVAEIQKKAAELSRQYRAFSRTQIEHMIGDAKTYTGSLEHAMDVMPNVLKLRTIEQGQTGKSSDRGTGAMIKAAELSGALGGHDPRKADEFFETMAKLRNFYKETFRPEDIKAFYSAAAAGATKISKDFMLGTGGHLIQEIQGGGGELGNDLAMLHRVSGGRASARTYEGLAEAGVKLDESKIVRNKKTGAIMRAKGGVLPDTEMLYTDPDKWLLKHVKPGFDKLPEDKQLALEQELFGNISQLKFADKVLRQQAIIEKDRAGTMRAPGLSAADTWMQKDPRLNAEALSKQVENAARMAGKPMGGPFFTKLGTDAVMRFNQAAESNDWIAPATGAAAVGAGALIAKGLLKAGAKSLGQSFGEGAAAAATGASAADAAAEASKAAKPSNVGGVLKGAAKAPIDIAKGLWEGAAQGATEAVGAERLAAIGKGLVSSIKSGIVTGAITAAGEYGIDKAFGAMPKPKMPEGYDPQAELNKSAWQRAKDAASRVVKTVGSLPATEAGGDVYLPPDRQAPARPYLPKPLVDEPNGIRVPTMADQPPAKVSVDTSSLDEAKSKAGETGAEIKAHLDTTVTPKVDTGDMDAAKAKAADAGAQIKASLDVTAVPKIDTSGLDAAIAKAREFQAVMNAANATAASAGAGLRGSARSTGALHDGTEVR